MMSHCTASLKLTPWHEGTFSSSVIYSPPFPFPLVYNPLFRSCLKMIFIILWLSRSHSFPALQELRKGETEVPEGQISARPGFTWQLELPSSWPTARCKMSMWRCGDRNVTDSLGKYSFMYEAEPAGSGQRDKIVSEDSHQHQKQTGSRLNSLTDMLGWLAAIVNTIRQTATIQLWELFRAFEELGPNNNPQFRV